jgi:glycerol-3-phosphate dehydrogenase
MQRFIENHAGKVYDIIVIGGGITGAAVAYEAASRGFSVALVEKGDFSAATSAVTSKLIHGGLRYLANFEFGLVRESLRERRILENIAPNLVYPIPFLVPLYKHGSRKMEIIEPGMIIYDVLSYDKAFTWDPTKKLPMHHAMTRRQVMEQEPIVNPDELTGAVQYYDCTCLTPERLTLAFIKSAVKHGAAVSNYARVENFLREGQAITGVVVRDVLRGNTINVCGRLTINCAGPWADLVLDRARGEHGPQHVRRSEGIHIVTRKLTQHYAVGGLTPTGRPCNVIPWRGHSLIGTTDREYNGDPDHWQVTREKIEEYIQEINASFGRADLVQYSDVLYAYGGLRPLVEDETKDVYKTSRRYEIYDNTKDGLPGMVTVEGGKYTTSRNLAENVLRLACKKFEKPYQKSITHTTHLAGCEVRDMNSFLAEAKAAHKDREAAHIDYLARIYGSEFAPLMEIIRGDPRYNAPLNADGEMLAQVVYAIRAEMAQTLTDILIRRTGLGTLGYPGDDVMQKIAEVAARELHWDQHRVDCELEQAAKVIRVPA